MKIAVVTDSTAYIPKELRDKWKIHMVPLNVIFGNEAYQEEVDLSAEEFYQEVKQKGLLYITAASRPTAKQKLTSGRRSYRHYIQMLSFRLVILAQ